MKFKQLASILLLLLTMPVFAIDMDLVNIDGTKQNLKDFKGKWVVVNFWATWCPPCIAEMPDLQKFHDEHTEDALVIGINVEDLDDNALKSFLDSYFITYPVFRKPQAPEIPLGTVPGLPTSFLVSPEGNVEARQVGTITSEMIENFIAEWEAK